MGEYYRGVKLGTCSNMYYIRYEEMLVLKGDYNDDGASISKYYLKPGVNYRFPFPEEDDATWDKLQERDAFKRLRFNGANLDAFDPKKYYHRDITFCAEIPGGGYQRNIFVPCPVSAEFDECKGIHKTSGSDEFPIIFEMQTIIANSLTTVFKCGYCGQGFYFDTDEEIELVKKLLRAEYCYEYASSDTKEYWEKVIERIDIPLFKVKPAKNITILPRKAA
jgi:hypothetical protein